MELLSILLQVEAPLDAPAQPGGGMFNMMWLFVALFVIMYLFMIRPQQKKQKEIQKLRESLKVGDKVITSGGLFGKIKEIEDTAFLIEIADGVRVKVDKASVFATANDAQQNK